jgi:hypothetical protein
MDWSSLLRQRTKARGKASGHLISPIFILLGWDWVALLCAIGYFEVTSSDNETSESWSRGYVLGVERSRNELF